MTERNETMLRLVLWRKRMTQADLARRTGIDPASVSRIVRRGACVSEAGQTYRRCPGLGR